MLKPARIIRNEMIYKLAQEGKSIPEIQEAVKQKYNKLLGTTILFKIISNEGAKNEKKTA